MVMVSRRPLRHSAPRFELDIPKRPLIPFVHAACPKEAMCPSEPKGKGSWSGGGATELLPHLFLGSHGDACSTDQLQAKQIRRILNVAAECDLAPTCTSSPILTKHLKLRDHSDEDISDHFEECIRFIHDGIIKNEAVLVHCRFGVSRSATIVLAYLMQYGTNETNPMQMSYEECFNYVKERRPQVSPNLGFVLALHQRESDSNSPSSSFGSCSSLHFE